MPVMPIKSEVEFRLVLNDDGSIGWYENTDAEPLPEIGQPLENGEILVGEIGVGDPAGKTCRVAIAVDEGVKGEVGSFGHALDCFATICFSAGVAHAMRQARAQGFEIRF